MSRKPKKSRVAGADKAAKEHAPAIDRWRLWRIRLVTAVAAPLILLLLLEVTLRLAGFGYATRFLLTVSRDGHPRWEQNNKFGWRFFGRQMSRTPAPVSIAQSKPANAIRIFVLGESAAFGDPQPSFGLPRMIEAMLSLRHPGTRFEVVNAAMTGINSHSIVPIARDCAKAGGDVWVVYMGNNEVVGPFGAGTIFGPQSPPLPLIRASLALKTTRTGELLDLLRQALQKPAPEKGEWGGMLMFLDQQVRADDARMKSVYHHFERNLSDIIQAGRRSGAGVVVSTVAVNLKDSAPFASAFKKSTSASQQESWKAIFQRGVEAQAAGRIEDAGVQFHRAAQIDDTVAELRFRQAWCAMAGGYNAEAQEHFAAARDLDTLRFRCDSRLNELIRRVAGGRENEGVLLADSERAFAEQSPAGAPGSELFYEHVHLTFEGNYQLARSLVPRIEKLLPASAGLKTADPALPWPSALECAHRLAWNERTWQAGLGEILTRLADPPFTGQLSHDVQVKQLTELIAKAGSGSGDSTLKRDLELCENAVAGAPDDPLLQAQLASLKSAKGDLPGALAAARRSVQLLPSSSEGWFQVGSILSQQKEFEKAAEAFGQAFELDSQDVAALQNRAQALAKLGRLADAEHEYRHAIAIKPRFGMAWLGLGSLLEESGRKDEAQECFRNALAHPIRRAPELTTLARFSRSHGWLDAAATNYLEAVKLSPADPMLRIEAGQSFAAAGRRADAAQQYAEAARLAPGMMQARYLHGLELGNEGKAAEAVEEFQAAVRLMPELPEARLNLGVALMHAGRNSEALTEFEEVLKRNPTNELALKNAEALRATLGSRKSE